ncbi:hypothetical protein SAMN06272737_1592 [Blastococcus mobilis]|uniref:Major Facilitator Superfamily protein n=1 Tax=Blastococcus mobilis TaxID=1938746 RepID=A0A239AUF8_9ACTN|nr:hypothetical protein SAMN06272737_1592 [Blastococcus mobilis]
MAQLTTVLVLLGAASGTLDVAMNTAAINFQVAVGRHVLARLHGGYSLGVLAGAGGGAVATHLDVSVGTHFAAVAALLSALSLVAAPGLVRQTWPALVRPAAGQPAAERPVRPAARLPMTVGLLAVTCLLVEGLVTDWSALLVTRDLGAGATHGAMTLALFSLAMFISRSCGDAALGRLTEPQLLVTAAVVMLAVKHRV